MELKMYVHNQTMAEAKRHFQKLGFTYRKKLSSKTHMYLDKWENGKGERIRIVKATFCYFDETYMQLDEKTHKGGVWIESLQFYEKTT